MRDLAAASRLDVAAPYRLDLTVAVLRRFSTNLVDIVAPDGTYLRAHLDEAERPYVIDVRQEAPETLVARIRGIVDGADVTRSRATALVRRVLGTDRQAAHFAREAATLPWLAGLVGRMTGVRAPRYATLWEACVNAIVFQQVSLHAAGAILGRTVRALGTPLELEGRSLYAFFSARTLARAQDEALRTAGLSVAKIATLRRVAAALEAGDLDEAELAAMSSPEAAARLCAIKGIGPWTAAVILLRGLGRLDVFPQNDSGIARSLQALTHEPVDIAGSLARLAPEQGMLYYHLLLARLEARGDL